jgi:AbrB family looped-hinge helix DNA binding protein
MPDDYSTRVGRRGTIVIPAGLRRAYRLDEGSIVIAEARPDGILLRPAAVYAVELYAPERRAQFLLENALGQADYAWACQQVREMGLDPAKIPHARPPESDR